MARASNSLAKKLAFCAGSAMLAIALPSSVVALGLLNDADRAESQNNPISFTPAAADPRLAEMLAELGDGSAPLMRFTPASSDALRSDRSVTVAVRVDQKVAEAISQRSMAAGLRAPGVEEGGLRVASTRYNLGLARGYSSFARVPTPALATRTLSDSLSGAEIPDLAAFRPSAGVAEAPSRFTARIEMEEDRPAAQSAEAVMRPGDQLLDVGGSYRLTRNLDVTAGVRYQQDRELRPLPQLEQQDSQAVYIGTQFRF